MAPAGRRPGPTETRDAILSAARHLFSERGYDGTSIRAIATHAGVNPGLVHHFFGTKQGVFVAALDLPFDPAEVLPAFVEGPRDETGQRVVRFFLRVWEDPRARAPLLALIRSAMTNDQVGLMVRQFFGRALLPAVLHDLSFSVSRGSVTGVLGPSGCGKTTLLRCIVGVQIVARGSVTVLGSPAGSAVLRRRIGYATQTPAVYADLTVAENLRYFAKVLDAPPTDVDRVIAQTGLIGHENQVVADLSGGELSRSSLAVALLGSPELLVLDEPTADLDPVLRNDLWTLFHQLAMRGATLFVSSHVMDEAERCDRLLLMREGRILTNDTPDGLRDRTHATSLEQAFLRLVEQGTVPA